MGFNSGFKGLTHSQVPATCPYPEPDQSGLCLHILFPKDPP